MLGWLKFKVSPLKVNTGSTVPVLELQSEMAVVTLKT